MNTSAGAAATPTADPYLALLPWIQATCGLGDPVRDDAYRCGLSAIVHRLLKFGFEESLNRLNARDCLNCCLLCGGQLAEFFLRTAFTRALIEDDQPIVSKILQTPFIPESRAWLARIAAGLTGDDKALAEAAAWLDTVDGEERAIATLLIGRVYPHFAQTEWLAMCPTEYPRLAAEMALLLLRQPEYDTVVKAYLREHPEVRYAIDDERWSV